MVRIVSDGEDRLASQNSQPTHNPHTLTAHTHAHTHTHTHFLSKACVVTLVKNELVSKPVASARERTHTHTHTDVQTGSD